MWAVHESSGPFCQKAPLSRIKPKVTRKVQFSGMPVEQEQFIGYFVNFLLDSSDYYDFREPVDYEALSQQAEAGQIFLDYPKVVPHAMDLGTIASKVKERQYRSLRAVTNDVHLMVQNAETWFIHYFAKTGSVADREVVDDALKLKQLWDSVLEAFRNNPEMVAELYLPSGVKLKKGFRAGGEQPSRRQNTVRKSLIDHIPSKAPTGSPHQKATGFVSIVKPTAHKRPHIEISDDDDSDLESLTTILNRKNPTQAKANSPISPASTFTIPTRPQAKKARKAAPTPRPTRSSKTAGASKIHDSFQRLDIDQEIGYLSCGDSSDDSEEYKYTTDGFVCKDTSNESADDSEHSHMWRKGR